MESSKNDGIFRWRCSLILTFRVSQSSRSPNWYLQGMTWYSTLKRMERMRRWSWEFKVPHPRNSRPCDQGLLTIGFPIYPLFVGGNVVFWGGALGFPWGNGYLFHSDCFIFFFEAQRFGRIFEAQRFDVCIIVVQRGGEKIHPTTSFFPKWRSLNYISPKKVTQMGPFTRSRLEVAIFEVGLPY